jgi:hypothetical protein
MSNFSPSDAALEGFRLTRERPGTILAWAGVYFAGIMLLAIVIALGIGPKYFAFIKDSNSATDIDDFSNILANSTPTLIVGLILAIFLSSILLNGINRAILKPNAGGFSHLKIGSEEVRVSIVSVIIWVTLTILLSPVAVSLGVLFYALQSIVQGDFGVIAVAKLAMSVFMFALTATPLIWIGVRLSLLMPHTFYTNRIDFRGAWQSTKGEFWHLAGMMLLVATFYAMVALLLLVIDRLGVFLVKDGAESGISAPMRYFGLILSFVLSMIAPVLLGALLVAPFARAYQLIKLRTEET